MTAVLAILAVSVPASVTLIGYWIQRQAGKRLDQQNAQENARLKLESVMRATELFVPSGDTVASAGRTVSGLLALTQLDHAALAIGLLEGLWPAQIIPAPPGQPSAQTSIGVSTETAILVINAALTSDEPTAQLMAADLLYRNSGMLNIDNPLHWPSMISSQWIELPVNARLFLVEALVDMALASNLTENSLRELALRLYGIWEGDREPAVRDCASAFLSAILPSLLELGYSDFMRGLGHGPVLLEQMEQVARTTRMNPDDYFARIVMDRRQKLAQWSAPRSL
jgi:hypothetical protein